MEIHNRIKLLRDKINLSATAMGGELNMSQSAYSKVERGELRPSAEMLAEIVRRWGVSANWLLTGEGAMFGEGAQTGSDGDMVKYVYRTEIYASAGTGYLNGQEHDVEIVRMDPDVARKLGINKNIEVIRVKGDSMEPKYASGDMVFVDRSDNVFSSEGIYVIIYMGTLMVKYLQRIKGGIKIRSINRAMYDDIDMTPDEFSQEDCIIVGKVRGAISFS